MSQYPLSPPTPPSRERLMLEKSLQQLEADLLQLIAEFEATQRVEVSEVKTSASEGYLKNGVFGLTKKLEVVLRKQHQWRPPLPPIPSQS